MENKLGEFYKDSKYPKTSLVDGSLIYIEKSSKIALDHEIQIIRDDPNLNPSYIWGYISENNAVYVIRAVGENKVFIYNPNAIKKTDYVKSKLKALKKLNKQNIDDLFEQKAVFDTFYKKLWDLRLDLGREIRDKNNLPDNVALMEAQHIIDRIIFTYFVCEKKLVSIKGYGAITGKELFSDIIAKTGDEWGYLKKLFFEQFAREDSELLNCGKNVLLEVKYLNGGLFREKELADNKIKETNLEIDYEWDKIFNILNKYTWILENDIPNFEGEYEGNLTPEIIGHIYEKFVISIELLNDIKIDQLNATKSGDLKKGNKKIGAYYTEEHITDYISRNTINPYLFNKIGISNETNFEMFLENSNEEILQKALDILNNITLCDPAAGSGAFLIKAGEILLEYKFKINKRLNNQSVDRYALKKDIIINNLYGVDLQEGAIEICKLRLWLWLISNAKTNNIEPLPNIEYNFFVGNSLIGWLNEKIDQNLLIKVDDKAIWILDALKAGYGPEQKRSIDLSIELLKNTDMKSYAKSLSLLKSLYSYSVGENAEILKKTIERIRSMIYEKIDNIFYDHLEEELGIKITLEEFRDLSPFHWGVDFENILNDSGFNIMIGNPPYGNTLNSFEKRILDNIYPKFTSRIKNAAMFFIFRGENLIEENGQFSYIIPKSVCYSNGWNKTANFLAEKLVKLIDVGKAFDGVKLEQVIFVINKKLNSNNYITGLSSKKRIYEEANIKKEIFNEFNILLAGLKKDEIEIIDYILGHPTKWGDFVQLERGLNWQSKVKKNMGEFPIFRGSQLNRYHIDPAEDFINLDKFETKDYKYQLQPKILNQLAIAHVKNPYPHFYLQAVLDEKNRIVFETISCTFLKDSNLNLKFLLAINNSKLFAWILYKFVYTNAIRSTRYDEIYISKVPVPDFLEIDQTNLAKISDYLIFLQKANDSANNPLFEFLDKLVDYLVYELFFKDILNTNLDELVLKHHLDNSKINETKISNFVKKIKSDSDITKEIKEIEDNYWIRIIEGNMVIK